MGTVHPLMAPPSEAKRALVLAGAVGIVFALAAGSLKPQPQADARASRVPWGEDGRPARVACLRVTGLASPQVLALHGLDADAGEQYVDGVWCADADADGGTAAALPGGMTVVDGTSMDAPADAGTEAVVLKMQGEAGGFACACSTGSSCEALGVGGAWAAAPKGVTLAPGAWRGAGCTEKTCVELQGRAVSMPAECAAP